MKSTLPGAMRPDRSAAPLMPMAASGACATIEPSVSIKRMLRSLNSTPGPSGERCRIASSIFTWRSESSPLMASSIMGTRLGMEIGPWASRP